MKRQRNIEQTQNHKKANISFFAFISRTNNCFLYASLKCNHLKRFLPSLLLPKASPHFRDENINGGIWAERNDISKYPLSHQTFGKRAVTWCGRDRPFDLMRCHSYVHPCCIICDDLITDGENSQNSNVGETWKNPPRPVDTSSAVMTACEELSPII